MWLENYVVIVAITAIVCQTAPHAHNVTKQQITNAKKSTLILNTTLRNPSNITSKLPSNDTFKFPLNFTIKFPSNGTFKSPSNGTFKLPSNINLKFPSNSTFKLFSNGSFQNPTNRTIQFPFNGTLKYPPSGNFKVPPNKIHEYLSNGTFKYRSNDGILQHASNGTLNYPSNGTLKYRNQSKTDLSDVFVMRNNKKIHETLATPKGKRYGNNTLYVPQHLRAKAKHTTKRAKSTRKATKWPTFPWKEILRQQKTTSTTPPPNPQNMNNYLPPLTKLVPCNQCPRVYLPVCGNNFQSYTNLCFMRCRGLEEDLIYAMRRGICINYKKK